MGYMYKGVVKDASEIYVLAETWDGMTRCG
jgi:hypothetical protein